MIVRRAIRWIVICVVVGAAIVFGLAIFVESDVIQPWIREVLISQLEQRTGTRIEIKAFHLDPWVLRADIDDLTVHGLEAPGAPPLFHAGHATVALRILSFFGRRIALDQLIVDRPQLNVHVEKDGRSNLPHLVMRGNGFQPASLFNLQIGLLQLRDGSAVLNDRRAPFALQGHDLEFGLTELSAADAQRGYIGNLRWQQVELAEHRDRPFRFDVSVKFTMHPNSFSVDELICKFPHSDLNLQAEMPDFAKSEWNLKYRGSLSLDDVRTIFRQPTVPGAIADFSGQAHYAFAGGDSNDWTASGYYRAHDIRLPYVWFHASGFETWGDYQLASSKLLVPNLNVRALEGALEGKLEMDIPSLAFRTQTHFHGASLAAALAAVDNPSLPVNPLHWDASMDVDSVNTWQANFAHFRTAGVTTWSPPADLAPDKIPITALVNFDYSNDRGVIELPHGQIKTPTSEIDMDGPLAGKNSAIEVMFKTSELRDWDDFINVIRGPDAEPRRITGAAAWNGRILGPIEGPTFAGHMQVSKSRYDKLYFDAINGDMEYSPDLFRLTNASVKRGSSSATFALYLGFDGEWGFQPQSSWSVDANIARAPSDDLQAMFETNYPAKGFLSGDLHGSGTRDDPVIDANFMYDDIETKVFHFDRLSGRLHAEHDQIRLSSADLRRGSARIDGNFFYRPRENDAVFDLAGSNIDLATIRELQSQSMPVGGQLDFRLKGGGPLLSPAAQGDFQVKNLNLSAEKEGSFGGHLDSDGKYAHVSLASELVGGHLDGQVTLGLSANHPISGRLSVVQFDLDPFIVSGFHLSELTGHSSGDGAFTISGSLSQPDSIEVDADVTRLSLTYAFVQLSNDQDIRVSYRRNEVRIEQAHLHGTDTDLQLNGTARFDRDQPLRLSLSGGMNLRLLEGILPDLNSQGRADANVSIEGTISSPRVTGRASIRGGAATYAEFPMGLSNVNGDVVFDKSRLVFDRLTAEAGGGTLTLNGNLSYGEGALRYEVNATTSTVRIRYPMGMSWLASGTLQLAGTSRAALISGKVQLQRLLFAQGVDVASFFAAASETPAESVSGSSFLQNLTFDVQGQTTPGARIEWTGAEVDMDGNVRLRGSWDRPVLLGNIHILGGEMPFRGNTYQLTRGDINFANPFRLDPVLDVEATSTISQYQVTIDFSGPASHLALNYRSDPPLPQTEIIGLLALGRTGQETGPVSQAASQNYGATALLSEAISSGLGGRIERLFGISQFRVDPFVAGTATESNAAARVTIEEQLAHDLTITYSTNAATTNQYQLIQVEYAVSRGLSVVFLRDINGTNGLDIKFVKRVK